MGSAIEIGADPVASMVLLLLRAYRFTEDELRSAAEKAWRVKFTVRDESEYFVMSSGSKGFVRAGPHFLSVLCIDEPYLGRDPKEYATTLPQRAQRVAW